jgi:hypothetical protein
MSFTSLGERSGRKNEYDHNIGIVTNNPPPAYDLNSAQADRDPHWFDVRYWSKKALVISALALVVIVVIVIAVAVVEVKKNAYPDYSKLNYSLVDQCMAPSAT